MNNFWVGLKNKKGLFLAILALFTVATSVVDNRYQAYAEYFTEDYRYSVADCKDGGFEYQPANGGHRGCKVNIPDIKDGKVGKTTPLTIEGPEYMSGYDKYVLNDGGSCFQGYSKKDYNGVNVCERKGKKDKNTAYPKGRSTKDKLGPDECKKIGGYWGVGGNVGNRQSSEENCYLNDMNGDPQGYNNMSSLPNKYLTAGDCAKGYEKSEKTQLKDFTEKGMVLWGKSKRGVYTCAKKGTKAGDNVEKCNKKENQDSEECKNNPAGDDDSDSDGSKDKNSCAIEWIGWIICPVVRASTGMVVSTYSLMQKNFLNIKADEIFQQDKPAFKTWSGFRDMANVFFVIVLAIIIFSQVSGVGISNYGIKKMLPKIIVFAILVNISWYVSVLMIDISNIVGHTLFEWLAGPDGKWDFSSDSQEETSPVEGILSGAAIGVGTAAAITGALAAGTSALMFLFSAALALIMMLFILLVRQAAVIVLVVISPLAFVAGILPNTEGFFRKWAKFLKNMLMIYPICSLIVGGAIFVSNLLYSTESSPLLKLAYGLLPILSLFTIVAIIKSILSIIDNLTGGNLRGTLDRMSGRLANATENNQLMRTLKEKEGNRTIKGIAIGKNAREERYQQKSAARDYGRKKKELNRLLGKGNLSGAERVRAVALGSDLAAYEKKQVEGMSYVMTKGIAGSAGNVDNYLKKISNVSNPAEKGMMQGALTQAVANSNLSGADKTAATTKIIDNALQDPDKAQIQTAMVQISSNMSSDMKNANPAMVKALAQNPSGGNLQKVSDLQQQASTYSNVNAQQMAGWSEMSKPNPADNQAINAVKSAFKNGDQNQIAHAQSMGKVADQVLQAHNDGKMFLTPNQERNFKELSNTVKASTLAAAAAAPAKPTPAPAPASSQNVRTGVNNNTQNQYTYGAPAPTPKSVVGQYKSNKP